VTVIYVALQVHNQMLGF